MSDPENVAPPPDAAWVSPWGPGPRDGHQRRIFLGTRRETHGLTISILGAQDDDGTIAPRTVEIGHESELLTADQLRASAALADNPLASRDARDVAAAMLEAAAEIDTLEG
jgi:hypothetical protein